MSHARVIEMSRQAIDAGCDADVLADFNDVIIRTMPPTQLARFIEIWLHIADTFPDDIVARITRGISVRLRELAGEL